MFAAEIRRYYPEISHLKVSCAGSFTSSGGHHVDWVNVTALQFDQQAAQQLFSSVEQFAREGIRGLYQVGDADWVSFQAMLSKGRKSVLYIVPPYAPTGRVWGGSGIDWLYKREKAGATYIPDDGEANLTMVRLLDAIQLQSEDREERKDAVNVVNLTLAVEVAQNLVHTTENGKVELDMMSQEIVANSIGLVLFARQAGMSYYDYREMAAAPGSIQGKFNINHRIFTKEAFEQIPRTPFVLKR